MSLSRRRAPARASPTAMARPNAPPAAVINATRPSSRKSSSTATYTLSLGAAARVGVGRAGAMSPLASVPLRVGVDPLLGAGVERRDGGDLGVGQGEVEDVEVPGQP